MHDHGRRPLTRPSSTDYRLAAEASEIRADLDAVNAAISSRTTAIVDVRTAAEFDGERFWPSGGSEPRRPGRPCAVGAARADRRAARRAGAFKPIAELRAVFGVDRRVRPKSSPTARSAAAPAPRGSSSPSCSATTTSPSTTARGRSGAGRPKLPSPQPLSDSTSQGDHHVRTRPQEPRTHPRRFARSTAAPATSRWSTSTAASVGRATFLPGWRWSEHVKPIAGTDSCQAAHLGYFVSGRMTVVMDDGETVEYGPGDFADMAPGHDAWIVGDEPCVFVDWQGYADYAKR